MTMFYKFRKDWVYSTYCVVEADSLEKAKELAEDAEWDTDNGGEHYLESKAIFAGETEEEAADDCGEYIEWND